MSARRRIRALTTVLAGAALALGGCDKGPSGPGTLDAEVRASEMLGAAVLRIEGGGIDRIEGTAGTRAFVGPVVGESRKIILVGDGTSDLRFEVEVRDLGGPQPRATVESAVDPSNQDLPALGGMSVHFSIR